MLLFVSCGGDDSTETSNETTSAPTIEYLCSTTLWFYAPKEGIKQNEDYSNFSFQRISNVLYCTAYEKYWLFSLSGSTLTLREREYNGNVLEGGETKILSVYKLVSNDNNKYLLINGKRYVATVGGGVDL